MFGSFVRKILGSSSDSLGGERRKSHRINIDPRDRVHVSLLIPEGPQEGTTVMAQVKDMSEIGFRLGLPEREWYEKVGLDQVMSANVEVDGFAIPMLVQVARKLERAEIGVQFKAPYPKELSKLVEFLEPKYLGLSLREIDQKALRESDKGKLRWFQGLGETNLFCWFQDDMDHIQHFQLSFQGKILDWQDGSTAKTGVIEEGESIVKWKEADLINFDEPSNINTLKCAAEIINAAKIGEELKRKIIIRIN